MDADHVKKTRNDLRGMHGEKKALKIRLDNNFEIHELRQFVEWDDINERIIWCERTEEPTIERDRPIFIHVSHYENIQEIYTEMSPEELKAAGSGLGLSDQFVDRVIGSIVLTLEDYSDSCGNHVKGRAHDVTI